MTSQQFEALDELRKVLNKIHDAEKKNDYGSERFWRKQSVDIANRYIRAIYDPKEAQQ